MSTLDPVAPAAIPTDDTTLDLHTIRADLEEQRRFRLEQLRELDGAVTSTGVDGAHAEVLFALRKAARTVLADIDAALGRIDLGRYGRCRRCGDAIARDRLESLPMVALCMPCQYAAEVGSARRTTDVPGGRHLLKTGAIPDRRVPR